MSLKLHPPFPPMEALSVDEIPIGPEWQYEPKWDGFRCLIFRDGKTISLQSKAGRSLNRYFPEIVDAVGRVARKRFVLDGELAIPEGHAFSFDHLLQRIHPAASRIKKLAAETPAIFIAFDLLAEDAVCTQHPLSERRDRLERFARTALAGDPRFRLS